jgi:hypothetical protein
MMNEYTSNKLDEYISNVNQTVEQILVMHSLDQGAHIHGWHENEKNADLAHFCTI